MPAARGWTRWYIEKAAPGGQAGFTQIIDNYPGFDEGFTGQEFGRRLVNQARRFGAEVLQAQEVTTIRTNGRYREVLTNDGRCYAGRAVLIATGARYRRMNVPGQAEPIGLNVHFCATCDGAFYKGQEVLKHRPGQQRLPRGPVPDQIRHRGDHRHARPPAQGQQVPAREGGRPG